MLKYIKWFIGFGAINHFLSLWQRRTFQLASWMGTALLWVPQKSQPHSHALSPHDRYPVAHKLWLDGRCFWPKVKNCWPRRCRHLSSSHWGIFGGSSDWMPKPILARLELGIRLKHFAVSNNQKSDDVIRKRDFLVEYYRQTLRWMNFIEMFFFSVESTQPGDATNNQIFLPWIWWTLSQPQGPSEKIVRFLGVFCVKLLEKGPVSGVGSPWDSC